MSSPGLTVSTQVFRLSPQQRRIHALARAAEAGGTLRALAAIRLEGRLDRRALEAALGDVAARHEILRTVFPMPAGLSLPGQVILDDAPPPRLDARDLSTLEGSEREAAVERLWQELAAHPFRPEQEPPLAAVLAVLEPERHLLLVALDALLADEAALCVDQVAETSR